MKRTLRVLALCLILVTLFAGTASALTFETLDNNKVFSDETIKKEKMDSWAREEIMAAREAGLIPMLTDDPAYKDDITREQFAELVVKTVEAITGNEAPMAAADTFVDTANESVLKANGIGVITGRGAGVFDPKSTATRQEIATMISRALDYIKAETGIDYAPLAGDVENFPDKESIASWAEAGVGRLAANGIMAGKLDIISGQTFAFPAAKCTVQESIILLYRVYTNTL